MNDLSACWLVVNLIKTVPISGGSNLVVAWPPRWPSMARSSCQPLLDQYAEVHHLFLCIPAIPLWASTCYELKMPVAFMGEDP